MWLALILKVTLCLTSDSSTWTAGLHFHGHLVPHDSSARAELLTKRGILSRNQFYHFSREAALCHPPQTEQEMPWAPWRKTILLWKSIQALTSEQTHGRSPGMSRETVALRAQRWRLELGGEPRARNRCSLLPQRSN